MLDVFVPTSVGITVAQALIEPIRQNTRRIEAARPPPVVARRDLDEER
jgi:hypothetical protein